MCVQKADVAGRRGQRHRQVRAEDDIGVLSGRVPSGRLSGIWTPPENWTSLILELPAGYADFREIKGSNTPDGEGQLQQQIDSLLTAGITVGATTFALQRTQKCIQIHGQPDKSAAQGAKGVVDGGLSSHRIERSVRFQ